MRSVLLAAALLVAVLLPPGARALHAADPVAVLLKVQGGVRLQRAGATAPAGAAVGARLLPGDLVLVPAGAQAVLLHRTGRVETVRQDVRISAGSAPARSDLFAQTVQTLAEVATTDARRQPNRAGMIRPVPGAPVPIAPRNQIVLLEQRPRFHWFRVPDAERYVVQLRRLGGKPVRYVVESDTSWTLPSDAPELVPGEVYEWTVGPADDGRPAPPQRFRVASASERAELEERLARLRAAGTPDDEAGILLQALAYRQGGFWYEVERLLARLPVEDAGSGWLLHQLRGEAYDLLGDLDAAEREFARAGSAAGR